MQALDLYMNRCDEYNQQVDETIKGNSEKLLKSARVLFVEYVFWQECKRSMVDHIHDKHSRTRYFDGPGAASRTEIACFWQSS